MFPKWCRADRGRPTPRTAVWARAESPGMRVPAQGGQRGCCGAPSSGASASAAQPGGTEGLRPCEPERVGPLRSGTPAPCLREGEGLPRPKWPDLLAVSVWPWRQLSPTSLLQAALRPGPRCGWLVLHTRGTTRQSPPQAPPAPGFSSAPWPTWLLWVPEASSCLPPPPHSPGLGPQTAWMAFWLRDPRAGSPGPPRSPAMLPTQSVRLELL